MAKLSVAAKRLPGELRKRGWSLRRLEQEAKIANGYLSKLCLGKRQPSADIAGRIERILGANMRAVLWSEFSS